MAKDIMIFSADVQKVFDTQDKYCNFSKLMIDTAMGKVKEYSLAEAEDKIREVFHSIMGTTAESKPNELRKAIRRHREDIFEVIEEMVENRLVSGWGDNPFFKEFVEMKSVNAGDTNEFVTEDKTILTVSKLSGGHHDIERQTLGYGDTFSVKTSWAGLKIFAEYEKFMAGRVDWARMVQKIYEAVDKYINDALYTAVMSAGSQLPNQAQFNKTGALSASTKDTLITIVEDVQTATGYEAVIMGTKTALSKLTALSEVNWISDSMKEERHATGRLGIWEGIRLVEIPQAFAPNDTTTKLVDNNKLLIMPLADNRFVKMFDEGQAQIKEVSDGTTNQDMTIEYEYQFKMGIGIVIGLYFGVWTITP